MTKSSERQHLSIDERMGASKERLGLKQYNQSKPIRWGIKMFAPADSQSGYTCHYAVYEWKAHNNSGKGLSFGIVPLAPSRHSLCPLFFSGVACKTLWSLWHSKGVKERILVDKGECAEAQCI